jgi:hypothetical protein
MRKENIIQPISPEELIDLQDSSFSLYERVVFSLGVLFLTSMLINAGWSYVLLTTGNVEGGGPLGALARSLGINCLTCLV